MPLRNANPANSNNLLLKRPMAWLGAKDEGQVAQVTQWIYGDGAAEMGLSTQPEYKKVVLTVGNIRLMVETLWLRPDDIPLPTFLHRIIIYTVLLNGCLTVLLVRSLILDFLIGAVAGLIVRHTVSTAEKYYMPHHVKYNLSEKIYKGLASEEKPLYDLLGQCSLKRDPEAPIYATAEQLRSVEGRRDLITLKRQIEAAKQEVLMSDVEASRKKARAALTSLQDALRRLRHALEGLLVAKARDEYFPEADRLRGCGERTDHIRSPDPRRRGPHSEMDLEGLVRLLTCADDSSALSQDRWLMFDGEAEKRSQRVMEWLLDYAAGRGKKVSPQKHQAQIQEQAQSPPTPPISSGSTCFLCSTESKPVTFSRRPELIRHCKNQHVAEGMFNLPFLCPECVRLGNEQYIVSSAPE